MEAQLERIREHVKVLNHSSERMSQELVVLSRRMERLETNQAWLMKLIWIVISGTAVVIFKVFAP
tara:strand:- start:309 stop:503 length:195 start_codon:yes stop_codon:yes gene_type:complete